MESRRGVYHKMPPPHIHIAYGIHPGVAYLEHTQNRYVQVAPPISILCVWYIELLLEVYETVNWSEMGRAIP